MHFIAPPHAKSDAQTGLGQLGWDRLSDELLSNAGMGFPTGNSGAFPPKLLNPRSGCAGTFLSFLVSALRKLVRRRNRERTPFSAGIVLALVMVHIWFSNAESSCDLNLINSHLFIYLKNSHLNREGHQGGAPWRSAQALVAQGWFPLRGQW